MALWETVTDLASQSDVLARRRFGAIETVGGRLTSIRLRPIPRIVWLPEVLLVGNRTHGAAPGDRCQLYYNQPWGHANFLALKYVVSSRDCRLATLRAALVALDEVARIKRSDALVCDAWNRRISERLLARWGWQPLGQTRWRRPYVKRFYGRYPAANWPCEPLLPSLLSGP